MLLTGNGLFPLQDCLLSLLNNALNLLLSVLLSGINNLPCVLDMADGFLSVLLD